MKMPDPRARAHSTRGHRTAFLAAILIASSIGLTSCQTDPSAWYPKGKASLASFYERTEGETTSCVLGILVENIGDSRISRSTVSLEVATGTRSYFTTLVSTALVLPGGKIYVNGSLSYADASEASSARSVSVVSEFYE